MKACFEMVALALAVAGTTLASEDHRDARSVVLRTRKSGPWTIRETANFRICTLGNSASLRRLPELCESLRTELRRTWLGEESDTRWVPRCTVIVHDSTAGYCRALGMPLAGGSPSTASVGCTTVQAEGAEGRVVRRRIDLRSNAGGWTTSALPHELTHVILADRFGSVRLPRWADEGMGVLAESHAKWTHRLAALRAAAERRTLYDLDALVAVERYPTPAYRDAFYAQSALLVRFLAEREGATRFVEFLERSRRHGREHALRTVYGIESAAELQTLWRANLNRHLAGAEPTKVALEVATRATAP